MRKPALKGLKRWDQLLMVHFGCGINSPEIQIILTGMLTEHVLWISYLNFQSNRSLERPFMHPRFHATNKSKGFNMNKDISKQQNTKLEKFKKDSGVAVAGLAFIITMIAMRPEKGATFDSSIWISLIMSLFIAFNSRWLVLSLLSFFEELKKNT
ncbi:hypothetical protein FYE33_17095 [Salmonella enterica]|nr:hypothetical protein [Salmonella enterica]EEP3373001.1 hypothetical protein [Salmonella enterica]EFP6579708.1 hypothetical protein [Salmonella enterica]